MGISQLADQIQSKRASLQDPTFRPDPLYEDWFRTPIVEFIQRHSSKGTSSSRERLDAAHETPRGDNLSGTPGVQRDAVGTRHPDESLRRDESTHSQTDNRD